MAPRDKGLLCGTCVEVIPSTSISVKLFKKFASDIIPLACFHDTSLYPRITTMHSDTICTVRGGLANDLRGGGTRQSLDSHGWTHAKVDRTGKLIPGSNKDGIIGSLCLFLHLLSSSSDAKSYAMYCSNKFISTETKLIVACACFPALGTGFHFPRSASSLLFPSVTEPHQVYIFPRSAPTLNSCLAPFP